MHISTLYHLWMRAAIPHCPVPSQRKKSERQKSVSDFHATIFVQNASVLIAITETAFFVSHAEPKLLLFLSPIFPIFHIPIFHLPMGIWICEGDNRFSDSPWTWSTYTKSCYRYSKLSSTVSVFLTFAKCHHWSLSPPISFDDLFHSLSIRWINSMSGATLPSVPHPFLEGIIRNGKILFCFLPRIFFSLHWMRSRMIPWNRKRDFIQLKAKQNNKQKK